MPLQRARSKRPLRGRRRVARRSLFPGFTLFDFRVVMANDAADGGPGDRMMTGDMSGYRTHGGAFETTLGLTDTGKCQHRGAYKQSR